MPTGQAFIKLPVKAQYIVDGRETVEVLKSDWGAAWAIVANAKLLAENFDWVPTVFTDAIQTYGNAFTKEIRTPQDQTARTESLAMVETAAKNQGGWVLVIKRNGIAEISGQFQPFARALLNELTGKYLMRPQNVSVGVVKLATIADTGGQALSVEGVDIEQLLFPPTIRFGSDGATD